WPMPAQRRRAPAAARGGRPPHHRMRPSANRPSSVDSPVHLDEGNERLVAVLKSGDWGHSSGPRGELPYRIDELRRHGFRLGWSDTTFRWGPRARRLADRVEAATVP